MTWATPVVALIAGACLIPPLILLYFLKLRRREQIIPSTLLWVQSVQDLQANAPFQRLKPNLLLFLQLLALLLLLIALAQPEWQGDIDRSSRTILLIDRSASMSATDILPTRLDEAKKQALQYIDGMGSSGWLNPMSEPEKVMIIGFASHAQVYSKFTSSRAELRKAIESITPTDGSSRVKDALSLARAFSTITDPDNPGRTTGSAASIILLSDGRISDLHEEVARERITYKPIGDTKTTTNNVAIIAFDAERNYTDLSQISVYARLANYGTKPISTTLFYSVGNQLTAPRSITIPGAKPLKGSEEIARSNPNEDTNPIVNQTDNDASDLPPISPGILEVTFEFPEPAGIALGIEIEYVDDLQSDNRAFVVIEPAKELRVGLVNPQSFVLESVLSGLPTINRLEIISPDQFEVLVNTGATETYDVIVLDDHPLNKVSPGRYLMFGSLPPFEGYVRSSGETKMINTPIAWEEIHPINRDVNYNSLIVNHIPVSFPESATRIVEGANGPMVVEVSKSGVQAIALPFSVLGSNWPWDVNLVLFLQNAIDYLGHIGQAVAAESIRPGEAIVSRLPHDATDIMLTMPNGTAVPILPSDPSLTTYGPVEISGLYSMNWVSITQDEQNVNREFAVNMMNILESDIRVSPTIELSGDPVKSMGKASGLQKYSLWPYALIAGLLIMMIEWFVYTKRAQV